MPTCNTCGTTTNAMTVSNKNQECVSDPWFSCEERNALKKCVKKVICDVLRCLVDAICAPQDGQFDENGIRTNSQFRKVTGTNLLDCLRTALCSFAECVPDALCGPRSTIPPITSDLPCDFAVEEQLSVQAPNQGATFSQENA